jgi:glycosyltransferase involved in cell wall biosynthesis
MDMVVDAVNGYLVDPGDTRALADRLLRVLSLDHATWRAMSEAALQTALMYSWDAAALSFETVFRQTLERRRISSSRPEPVNEGSQVGT